MFWKHVKKTDWLSSSDPSSRHSSAITPTMRVAAQPRWMQRRAFHDMRQRICASTAANCLAQFLAVQQTTSATFLRVGWFAVSKSSAMTTVLPKWLANPEGFCLATLGTYDAAYRAVAAPPTVVRYGVLRSAPTTFSFFGFQQ
jgi:hypothetical protein